MRNDHGHKIPQGSDGGTIRRPGHWPWPKCAPRHFGKLSGYIGAPAPSNSQATQVGGIQFVGLEIGKDRVDLVGDLFQFGKPSLVLDVSLDPFVDITLGGLREGAVFQHRSIGADNLGMKRICRSGWGRDGLAGVCR